jgi:hypothetical protein
MTGRARHRAASWGEIRRHFGFRVCGEDEGAKLAEFLADDLVQRERRYDVDRC